MITPDLSEEEPQLLDSPSSKFLGFGIATYGVLGLLLANRFRYQLNPDAISYISIARHYFAGHWSEAINAYWSPLYSWLLIPFFTFGSDDLLSAKLLNLVLGAAVLFSSWQLGRVVGLSVKSRRWLIVAVIPIVLQWACSLVTADLLFVAILLFYVATISRPDFTGRSSLALIAGVTGGLAFLSKAYALPLVLITFVFCLLWQFFASSITRKQVLRHFVLFGIAFSVLAIPWIALISFKYHRLTWGTAGAYNFAIINPNHPGHPMWNLGMFAPPNEYALSAWEDPTYLPLANWNPLRPVPHLTYWLHKIAANWWDVFGILNEFSYLAIPGLIAAGITAASRLRRGEQRYNAICALLLISLLLITGYAFIFVEERYVWFVSVVSLIGGLLVIEGLTTSSQITKAVSTTLNALLVLSFAVLPIFWLHDNLDVDRRYYETSRALPEMQKSRFVSNDMRGLYFAYYKKATFYGMPQETRESVKEELERSKIDYYFFFGGGKEPDFLAGFRRVSVGNVANLRVYKIDSTRL